MQLFRGTSRNGSTLPKLENGEIKYFAGYERITQIGSFVQSIYGPIIFKFEGIRRNGQKNTLYERENFYSYITGIEYVVTRVFDKIWDLNIFLRPRIAWRVLCSFSIKANRTWSSPY